MKNKTKVLASSALAIAMSASLAIGGTYALFTSEDSVNIAVTSGKVDVTATIKDVTLYSMDVEMDTDTFENGGTAEVEGNEITLTNVTPGDKAVVSVDFANNSNVTIQYRMGVTMTGDLAEYLKLSNENGAPLTMGYTLWETITTPTTDNLTFAVELPEEETEGQGASATISVFVEAVQGNAEMPATWDGMIPTAKPESLVVDTTNYLVSINSVEAFAYLNTLVNDSGFSANYGSAWKYTIELNVDVDLMSKPWTPIVLRNFISFEGNGHTVSNLNVSTNNNNAGLFASYTCNDNGFAYIRNLTIDGAYVKGGQNVGVLVGSGTGTVENITVINAIVDADKYVGGLAGRLSSAENCTVKNSTVQASDKTVGGLVGYAIGDPGNTTFTGNTVDTVTVTGAYNVGGMFGQAQNVTVNGNTVKNATVTSTTALPANASSNEVRTAELAARSAFDNTIIGIGTNTVENVTLQNK